MEQCFIFEAVSGLKSLDLSRFLLGTKNAFSICCVNYPEGVELFWKEVVILVLGQYIILQFLLWVTTIAFLAAFDYLAKKMLGVGHQGYVNLRLPKFIALVIASATIVLSLCGLNNGWISQYAADFLAIPYFAATTYFIAVFFRELKAAKSEGRCGN